MHFGNSLNSVQVVDTGIEADLVHDDDTGILDRLVEFAHGGRDVARGDNVGLALDGSLNHGSMIGVGDE